MDINFRIVTVSLQSWHFIFSRGLPQGSNNCLIASSKSQLSGTGRWNIWAWKWFQIHKWAHGIKVWIVLIIKPPDNEFRIYDFLANIYYDFFLNWQNEKNKMFWTNKKFVFLFNWSNWQKFEEKIGENKIRCLVLWSH